MSKKEKTIILYSRNGIKISHTKFIDITKWPNGKDIGVLTKNTFVSTAKGKKSNSEIIPAKKAWTETITRVSKLGFYYYETKKHDAQKAKIVVKDKYEDATYKKLVFKINNDRYEMIYPIKCGEVSINRETRPWDILPGTNGIEDHFITDLYKEVIKFFGIAEVNKIKYKIKDASYDYWNKYEAEYAKDMSWVGDVTKEVLLDLFGDEKGPSINYNNLKILSHGFDLKESFRKRKENDNK